MNRYKIIVETLDRAAFFVAADSIAQALKELEGKEEDSRWEVSAEVTKVEKVEGKLIP